MDAGQQAETAGAVREAARAALIERLRPFCEDSASMWLGGFLGTVQEWPEDAELNDIFVLDENGPMKPIDEIHFWDLDVGEAQRRLAELLHTGLAYGNAMEPERVAAAAHLADDLVQHLGPTVTWRISEEDWQRAVHGGRSKFSSDVTDDTFSALLIGRTDQEVLVLLAADED